MEQFIKQEQREHLLLPLIAHFDDIDVDDYCAFEDYHTTLTRTEHHSKSNSIVYERCASTISNLSLSINIDEIMSEVEQLTEEEIQDMVNYLLEKLNDIGEAINQLSIEKEEVEEEANKLIKKLTKRKTKLLEKHSKLNKQLETIIEDYFQLMYKVTYHKVIIERYTMRLSDALDELTMAKQLMTDIDYALGEVQHSCQQKLQLSMLFEETNKNIVQSNQPKKRSLFKEKALSVMNKIRQLKTKNTKNHDNNETSQVLGETTQMLRRKISTLSEYISHLETRLKEMVSDFEEDRFRYNHFCAHYHSTLKVLLDDKLVTYLSDRIVLIRLEKIIARLGEQVVRKRAEHIDTMADLRQVCTYVHRQDLANGKGRNL